MLRLQPPLPDEYTTASLDELERRIGDGQGHARRPALHPRATTTSATR